MQRCRDAEMQRRKEMRYPFAALRQKFYFQNPICYDKASARPKFVVLCIFGRLM